MGATLKAKNRKVRQEELREFISQRGKLSYVFDNIEKIEDENHPLDQTELKRLEVATNMRIRLLEYYMPKQKSIELSQDPDNPISELGDTELKAQIAELLGKLNDAK